MASGEVLRKFCGYYAKLQTQVVEWEEEHNVIITLTSTVTNILGRLPILFDQENYGCLVTMDDIVVTKLVTAQVKSLESLLQELQSAVSRVQACAEKMMKTYTNACHLVSQDRRMTPKVCKLGGGPIPSIEGCLDGLREIADMFVLESKLCQMLVSKLHFDTTDEETLSRLKRVISGKYCIRYTRIQEVMHVMKKDDEMVY
eukprot:jgi/Picsp_1/2774/NSC_01002-R1_hypothetical protein CHLNCDRAFT_135167 [Chlorella variabilis]